MTSLAYTASDTSTMFTRQIKRVIRSGYYTFVIGMPVVILLLFVYVFGATLGAGIVPGGDQQDYLEFVTPGIILFGIAGLMQMVSIAISQDMVEGIVARFRTMSISRGAVHAGHVWAGVAQGAVATAITLGLAILLGFRPTTGPLEWLLLAGVLLLIMLALIWFAVALGTVAKSVESASNLPMPFLLLPFFGSAFVPTDSMPAWLQWFAEFQPFTPFIETVRGLLLGTPIGWNGVLTVAWCLVIGVSGYVWSRYLYARKSVRG